jgi:hypothetical protein
MRSKAAFIVGTGVGYVLGTRAGRQRFEKIKGWTLSAWENPQVQARVSELEAKAADLARSEGAALKGRVTENLRSAVSSARGGTPTRPIDRYPVAPTGDNVAGGTSTEPGSPFTTPPGVTADRSGTGSGTV